MNDNTGKKKIVNNNRGFTLIEIVVGVAILALLAAVLVPFVGRYLEDARLARAKSDVNNIAATIANFNRDMALYPVFADGTDLQKAKETLVVLYTKEGEDPSVGSGTGWAADAEAATNYDTLENQLIGNKPSGDTAKKYPTSDKTFVWKGPYAAEFKPDPWGNKYLVDAQGLQSGDTGRAYVISAGPDRKLDTTLHQTTSDITVGGDDIVAKIK